MFDEEEASVLGGRNSTLGSDVLLGRAAFSVQDKFAIRIYVRDFAQYERFLPNGADCRRLKDLVYFYVGDEYDWHVELALPVEHVKPCVLGEMGALGWSSWSSPSYAAGTYRCDARFRPG